MNVRASERARASAGARNEADLVTVTSARSVISTFTNGGVGLL